MKSDDKKTFLKIIDSYFDYLTSEEGKTSLLARIYGFITLNTKYFDEVSIVIMQNTANMLK